MLKRYKESNDAYQQAIRLKPDFAEAHYGLGRTYLMLGDRDGALEEYNVLKTLDPKSAAELGESIPRYNLSRRLLAAGEVGAHRWCGLGRAAQVNPAADKIFAAPGRS